MQNSLLISQLINQLFVLKVSDSEECSSHFPELKVTSLNCLFCPSYSSEPSDIQFRTRKYDKTQKSRKSLEAGTDRISHKIYK